MHDTRTFDPPESDESDAPTPDDAPPGVPDTDDVSLLTALWLRGDLSDDAAFVFSPGRRPTAAKARRPARRAPGSVERARRRRGEARP